MPAKKAPSDIIASLEKDILKVETQLSKEKLKRLNAADKTLQKALKDYSKAKAKLKMLSTKVKTLRAAKKPNSDRIETAKNLIEVQKDQIAQAKDLVDASKERVSVLKAHDKAEKALAKETLKLSKLNNKDAPKTKASVKTKVKKATKAAAQKASSKKEAMPKEKLKSEKEAVAKSPIKRSSAKKATPKKDLSKKKASESKAPKNKTSKSVQEITQKTETVDSASNINTSVNSTQTTTLLGDKVKQESNKPKSTPDSEKQDNSTNSGDEVRSSNQDMFADAFKKAEEKSAPSEENSVDTTSPQTVESKQEPSSTKITDTKETTPGQTDSLFD